MAADIEDCGQRSRPLMRNIEVGRHIKPGQTLEDYLFYSIVWALERAGDLSSEWSALRHRLQTNHVKQLAAQLRAALFPSFQVLNPGQGLRGDASCSPFQEVEKLLMPGTGIFLSQGG